MKRLFTFVIALALIILPQDILAATIATNTPIYNPPATVIITLDTPISDPYGVLLFQTPYSDPFQCLATPGSIGATSTFNLYVKCISFGTFASSTLTEFTLLLQNNNTCWNGNSDNLATCLGRGQTIASTTFSIVSGAGGTVIRKIKGKGITRR